MVENVSMAIRIDERAGDALTTSMVDDVFYILQTCSRRAAATGSVQCVCAAFNHVNNLLANEYRQALASKLHGAAERLLASSAPAPGPDAPPPLTTPPEVLAGEAGAMLNDADVSADYVLKLKREMEETTAELFPAASDREKLRSIVADLAETAAAFRQLAAASLEELAGGVTQRVRPALDAAASASYELTEAQYAENEAADPWQQRLVAGVSAVLDAVKPMLTPANFDALVGLVADAVAARIEATVTQKRFNQLGGLQLDREARALVAHFGGLTQRAVRDKFARLTQIATVLNLETVSEILDYWGENAGPMTWRLAPAEVRRVLGLRVEFRPAAIAQLRL